MSSQKQGVKPRVPSYRKHVTGLATVRLNGRDIYLGDYGTRESRQQYDRVIAEWIARGRRLTVEATDIAIVELISAFWNHALQHYRRVDGTQTSELHCFNLALLPLKELYGDCSALEFGPLKLRAVRNKMIEAGWVRSTINAAVNRVRHVFKWGVGQELVPSSVWEAFRAVETLEAGRSNAPESQPVAPVPQAWVDAVMPLVSRQIETMINLQLLTGMRPGEVVNLRSGDIDMSGKVWIFRPVQHKTRHKGHSREIHIGPQAQELLKPFLKLDPAAWCFSPVDAEADRLQARHAERTTPSDRGNIPGSRRQRRPRRKAGNFYTTESYRRAIARGCEAAFGMPSDLLEPRTKLAKAAEAKLPADVRKQGEEQRRAAREAWHEAHVWSPNQLRHSFGTRVRKGHGLDTAQVLLGHRSADVTQVYAEADRERAEQVIADIG